MEINPDSQIEIKADGSKVKVLKLGATYYTATLMGLMKSSKS